MQIAGGWICFIYVCRFESLSISPVEFKISKLILSQSLIYKMEAAVA